jgi:Uma2 family endonuclease
MVRRLFRNLFGSQPATRFEGNMPMSTGADLSSGFSLGAAYPPLPVCRFTVEQYEAMIRAGIITEDDPIELLDGWITHKMTKNPPHVLASELVRNAIARILPAGWCVHSQEPVRLATSMPEPDVTVVRGELRSYRDHLPQAQDVALVVEVADASLSRDQILKKSIYAQAGIPCYWLVNLVDARIEEYTEPVATGESSDYGQRRDYAADGEIALLLDGRRISSFPVRDLLP